MSNLASKSPNHSSSSSASSSSSSSSTSSTSPTAPVTSFPVVLAVSTDILCHCVLSYLDLSELLFFCRINTEIMQRTTRTKESEQSWKKQITHKNPIRVKFAIWKE